MQFKLSTLLFAILVLCIYLGAIALPIPYSVQAMSAMTVLSLPTSVVGFVLGESNWRASWAGCVCMTAFVLMLLCVGPNESTGGMVAIHALILMSGLAAVVARWTFVS